ncbi:hypothetical protein CLV30_102238 [Haloactinopolyspora alba]|uniref:Uncharacterized protein n=2 Tax=Haloactinopolyspora alba TaxID=648780 RepID=A0A2P8EBJ6_9ACTN|nr:hypothetical protein CLV30_102238 [Haloactinopolyspora alba]
MLMLRQLSITALTAALAVTTAAHAGGAANDPDREARPDGAAGPSRVANGALGANFNQNLDSVNYRELREAGAQWVRGFYPMPATDDGDPAEHFAIRSIRETADRGFNTILALKFPYNRKSFPEPGSDEMAAELARLDQVLPTVMGEVDIMTIGNEPFIESLKDERDERLNVFYEAVARHVIEYRREHCGPECGTDLYMGALNRLDLPGRRTEAVERWMTFVRETPEIAGVDIHPHVPDPARVQAFLDYILPRMRPDQTFLVTEFSIVWYWRQHMRDPLSAEFAGKYGYDPGTLVWEFIRAAIENPVGQREWQDFLTSSDWFMKQSDFLRDQVELYRSTGRLAVTTYGFRQDVPMTTDFGPNKPPWLLNSVYAAYTVKPRGNGMSARGYWVDDFRALQRR